MISVLLQTLANFGFDVSSLNAAFNSALASIQSGAGNLSSLGSTGLSGILSQSALNTFNQGGLFSLLGQAFTNLTGIDDTGKSAIITALLESVSALFASGSAASAIGVITGA